ncbi:hypothetical protein M5J07_20930 [Achromobacter mucicolens]|uniref:hypothetical protein n=1 Tax=Achromobacter mucicolens TaxID=1389922 RepID=UPI0020A57325|nr:hypothetical protein [Achromobacter mucicolens]MCP2517417.1 hypothetical protein [Achromobacter mucicolens]
MSEPLFKGAHQALTYAFNYSSGTLDRPAMAKMADRTPRTGRGLAGVDGAAQAGFILRELQALSPLHQRILEAAFLPQTTPCPCCHSAVWNAEWLQSVRVVSDAAIGAGVLSGHVVHRVVRDGLVMRYFATKANRPRIVLADLASKAGISERTVTDQNGKITLWLRGSRLPPKQGGKAIVGQEDRAIADIESALILAGIVGTAEATDA